MLKQNSWRSSREAAWIASGLAGFYLLLGLLFHAQGWFGWVREGALLLVSLLAAFALGKAALHNREKGQQAAIAWGLLALAHLLFALGAGLRLPLQFGLGKAPFSDMVVLYLAYSATALSLLYFLLFAAGLLILPISLPGASERLKYRIDLAIIFLAGGVLVWNFLIAPGMQQSGWGLLSAAQIVAYPVLGLALATVLLRFLYYHSRQSVHQPLLLLEWSSAAAIIGTLVFAIEMRLGSAPADWLAEAAYLAAFALAGLAGLAQRQEPVDQQTASKPKAALAWIPYLPYLLGILAFFLLVGYERAMVPFVALASIVGVIFALIILRQVVSLRENARLYENELRRRRLAEALSQAGRELTGNLEFELVPGLVLDQLAAVLPYERCSIMIERDNMLIIAAQRGFPKDERTRNLRIKIREDDVFLEMAHTQQPVVYPDITQVQGWQIVPWLPLNKSWMGVPLIVHDRAIGMLSITRRPADAFSPDDALLAVAFAGQAAIALENARLYGELAHAYHNLEILDRTKSRFIEVVAHELRTPLTIIKGYSQALSSQPATRSDPALGPYLDGILRGIDRMHETVNDMLAVTKIDAQELKLRKKPTLLSIVLGEAAQKFEAALQERSLTLSMEGLKGLPPIQADPDLLNKVFMHLIQNAIKYTPDGGKISITAEHDEQSRMIEVVVSDNGIGIDPEQQQVIFEKFYQGGEAALHSSGKTKFKGGGPGLGLAIARGIVVAHSGRIWVESPGCDEQACPGSQFHLRLPVE
ncbi:MAG: GAF domain-containing protein [Anaerolineales bacterium]|nr:GAF domain-containing protein [Anaerolineales bacterium]